MVKYREDSPYYRRHEPGQPRLWGGATPTTEQPWGINPPRVNPPMTDDRRPPQRIGPVRPDRSPRFPGGVNPSRERYPGSPPKKPRPGPRPVPGRWGGSGPIVIDPRTGRPTWRWSPGASYATKVAGVYTDPEHMRRISELARWKPIAREAPPTPTPVEPVPAPAPTTPTPQEYRDYFINSLADKAWEKYGEQWMSSRGYNLMTPRDREVGEAVFRQEYKKNFGLDGMGYGVPTYGGGGAGEVPGGDWSGQALGGGVFGGPTGFGGYEPDYGGGDEQE